MIVDQTKLVNELKKFYYEMAQAHDDNRLPGYMDDRVFELEEQEPGLAALTKHMMAEVRDDVTPDAACHILLCLACVIKRCNPDTDHLSHECAPDRHDDSPG